MCRHHVLALPLIALSACTTVPTPPATLDGVGIDYTDLGIGSRALVFVHGWASDATVWSEQVPALADVGRLIVIDLPGHGRSDKPDIDYTIDYWARSVNAVLEHAGVDRAVLVGHSNGVQVVRQFYRQYPQKTLALVAVDGELVQVFPPNAFEGFVERLSGPGWQELVVGMTRDVLQHGSLTDEQKLTVERVAASTPQHVAVGGLRASMDPAVLKPDPITVPVLIVNAAQPAWDAVYVEKVQKVAPGLEYHELQGANHYLMMDDAEGFNELLRAFIEEHSLLRQ